MSKEETKEINYKKGELIGWQKDLHEKILKDQLTPRELIKYVEDLMGKEKCGCNICKIGGICSKECSKKTECMKGLEGVREEFKDSFGSLTVLGRSRREEITDWWLSRFTEAKKTAYEEGQISAIETMKLNIRKEILGELEGEIEEICKRHTEWKPTQGFGSEEEKGFQKGLQAESKLFSSDVLKILSTYKSKKL